jgi:3',5'-cyclic AMP phosphodiesterase CpdA
MEYSPNEVEIGQELRGLNARNIARIKNLPEKDTLRIAVTGDTQRYLNDSHDLVDDINSRDDVDFLIHTGDFTDFGINREYIWMAETFNELNIPWLVVVGNHDLVANGKQIYAEMFGDENFYLDHGDFRFLFYDNNSREAGFDGNTPNLNWLRSANDSTKTIVAIGHIPTYNHDFDQALKPEYKSILDNELDVLLKINGHHHDYGSGTLDNSSINYLNTFSCSKRKYLIVSLTKNSHSHEIIEF